MKFQIVHLLKLGKYQNSNSRQVFAHMFSVTVDTASFILAFSSSASAFGVTKTLSTYIPKRKSQEGCWSISSNSQAHEVCGLIENYITVLIYPSNDISSYNSFRKIHIYNQGKSLCSACILLAAVLFLNKIYHYRHWMIKYT